MRTKQDGNDYVVECPCRKRARFRKIVPKRFERFNLYRLKPQPQRHPLQETVINALRAQPDSSYLIAGRNQVGKSLMGWCMLRRAVIQGRRVVGMNLENLMDEYRAVETSLNDGVKPPRPKVLPMDLEGATNWFLLLQEFDKARTTAYASEKLFELIDMAINYEHQVVITSNLDLRELDEYWSATAPRFGRSIMSRVEEFNYIGMF